MSKISINVTQYEPFRKLIICDNIKRNESDVGNVVFEILAKTVFRFLCFIMFLASSNPS